MRRLRCSVLFSALLLASCSGPAQEQGSTRPMAPIPAMADAGVHTAPVATLPPATPASPAATPATPPATPPTPPATPGATVAEPEYVRFPRQSDQFTPAARSILDRMAEMIASGEATGVVRIEGHADPRERKTAVLSLRRAQRVMQYLIQKGVAADRLQAAGLGATHPASTGDAPTARAQNRRVEFSFRDTP